MAEDPSGALASAPPPEAGPTPADAPESARPRRTWWMWAVPGTALAVLLGFALDAEIMCRRRAEAIRTLREIGILRFAEARPPGWVSKLLGRKADPDRPAYMVSLSRDSASDDALAHVGWIPELECLYLLGSSVTDEGLGRIAGLGGLEVLEVRDADVTDAGLQHLARLRRLEYLDLDSARVTGSGLEHITGLTQLRILYLRGTPLTDAGLMHLGSMDNLDRLDVRRTRVTRAGVAELRRRLPRIYVLGP